MRPTLGPGKLVALAPAFSSQSVTITIGGQSITSTEGVIGVTNTGIPYNASVPAIGPGKLISRPYAYSPGGNVTVSLTGQQITSTEGAIGVSGGSSPYAAITAPGPSLSGPFNLNQFALSPFAYTASNPNVSLSLTGQSIASTEGTITATVSYALSGESVASTEGSIAASVAYSFTGIAATSSEGSIAPEVDYFLTGQLITSTEGTITASAGGNVTLALSGQAITSMQGSVSPNASYGISGQALTSTEGAIGGEVDYAVAGQGIASTEGAITASSTGDVAVQIGGIAAVFAQGAISVSGGTSATGAGKHRKRYGVMDGWKLLLFNTKADADAYRASQRKDIPAKKLKRIKTIEPAEVINLPALKAELPAVLVPRLEQMIRERQYGDIQALQAQHEADKLRAAIAKEKAEKDDMDTITHVVQAHRQMHAEHLQGIHHALKLLHEIKRLRSIR